MICPNCGTANEPGRKFCGECATRLAVTCPNCGSPNTPGVKFCGECGTTLAAATAAPSGVPAATGPAGASPSSPGGPVAERRLVSVLFADLVGFTPFAEERDAEEVRETLTRYFDLARDVIGRYGGTVEKFIGDAVMAVWGAPVAHEDDAERAVRAALELVDAVPTLGPGHRGPRRRADRRGRGHPRRDQPGHGRGRPRQHRGAPPVGGAARHGPRRRGDPAGRRQGDRLRGGRRAGCSRARQPRSRPGGRCASWPSVGGRNRGEALEAPFVGRSDELRLLKDLFHATGAGEADAARVGHRAGRHRQEPPRLGVPEVRRRPRRDGLVARRPLPRLRRGDHLLGAGRDGPRPLRACSRPTTRPTTRAKVARDRRDACRRRRRAALDRAGAPGPARGRDGHRRASSCSPPGGRSSSGWRATRPGRAGLRGPPLRRHGPARLHRPPARVEPRASRSTSSRWPGRSCSSGARTGAPASATSPRSTSSRCPRAAMRELLAGLVPGPAGQPR